MVSSHATIVANEAGNSIAVTDTQANIRHLVEIIKAIDSSAEDETELRVFHLKHHDPTEIANLLTGLFSGQGNTGGSQTPIRFGGPWWRFRWIWRGRFRWVCRTRCGGSGGVRHARQRSGGADQETAGGCCRGRSAHFFRGGHRVEGHDGTNREHG